MKKFLKENKKILLFTLPILLSLLISIIAIMCFHGNNWDNIFQQFKYDAFNDFFASLKDSTYKGIYNLGVIYPPLIYQMYKIFTLMIPKSVLIENSFGIRDSYEGQIIFLLYTIICVLISIFAIKKLNKNHKYSELLQTTFILSFPVLFCFQRGNSILLSFIFSCFYFAFYDSNNKYLKHLSLVSLAISANIKLYPALFGLLMIKDKRYKDSLLCIGYALIIFLLSFISYGGFSSVVLLFKNIFTINAYIPLGCENYLISLNNTVATFSLLFTNNINVELINKLLLLLFPISIIPFIANKKMWKNVLLISLLFICIPNLSFTYTLMFLFIPAVMLINEKKLERKDYIYLFVISLLLCTYGFVPKVSEFYFFVLIEKSLTSGLLLAMIIDGYYTFFKDRKQKKCQK